MSFKKLIPIFILIGFTIFGAVFVPMILGSVEAGQDQNISQAYKDQLNSTDDVSQVTISLTKFISPLLGFVALIIVVMWLNKR